ncbi:hypothetical protein [Bdellovibrio sp. NC01]|uniref:hypothetical protein n=1 Tax=Bdellovibrio sp. NC01 TaxID=2220073 RepID=UPI00115BF548|nr:hypothetical protein [Bdellovibrio sp. NC01]QDK37424.1 hypothetical protein DOE51_07405 [Bdellovibrio sp. NC01]
MKHVFTSLLFLSLSACSLYKSDGRKEFENDAPGKLKAASASATAVAPALRTTAQFKLKNCKKEGTIESWFNSEFPAASYELVVSETDLEIWRTMNANGVIEVKAIQKTDNATTMTCNYEFATSAVWDLYKDQFIRELENNLMTQD